MVTSVYWIVSTPWLGHLDTMCCTTCSDARVRVICSRNSYWFLHSWLYLSSMHGFCGHLLEVCVAPFCTIPVVYTVWTSCPVVQLVPLICSHVSCMQSPIYGIWFWNYILYRAINSITIVSVTIATPWFLGLTSLCGVSGKQSSYPYHTLSVVTSWTLSSPVGCECFL